MPLPPNSFPSKLPNVKTTIFTTMSRLAKEYDAINLSQGFPDFSTDSILIEEVTKAMKADCNQYAPMQGVLELREMISEKMNALYSSHYCPDSEITITAGATQAIFTSIAAFIRPGDEVLVLKPAFDCYEPAIEVNGGIPVFLQLEAPDYKVNWNAFRKKISNKTKLIILNTPHNPTGSLLTKTDLKELENIVKNTNILLLCDDVYEHILFDGEKHQSVCLYPELKKRAFIVSSFGKAFHITGWKVGYCLAPKELMHEFRKTHQYNVFCVNHPVQIALANYLKKPSRYLELSSFYQEKRDLFLQGLATSKFSFQPSKGTYFQLLDFSTISEENDVDFAMRMAKEIGVASIPISPFNTQNIDNKIVRFCFAKKNETLEKAVELLCKIY